MALKKDAVQDLMGSYERGEVSRRSFFMRATAMGVTATTAGGLLAACGGSANKTANTNSVQAPVTTTETLKVQTGGTLMEGYDRSFSPITTTNAAWVDPTHDALLESLLTYDPKGNLTTKLAESYEVSSDAMTWTFKLRDGLKFHSGKLVTPAIVAECLNTDRSKIAQHPYWYTQVTSIKPGPGNTVVIKCNKPFKTLGDLYIQQFSNIYNPAAVKSAGKNYGTKVVDGTGPFQLVSFDANKGVKAKRFEQYPGTGVPWESNKGPAYLDAINWVPITEQANRANEITSGNVHVVKNPLPSDIPGLKSNSDLVVIEQEEAGELVLGLNWDKKNLEFAEVKVRQAISHAIDRDAIVTSVLQGQGSARLGPFPKSYKWYEPKVEQFNQYDPAKSAALFKEAGWTKGSDGILAKNGQKMAFSIVNQSDATKNQVGDALVGMLAKVGVQAKMKNLETAAYFPALGAAPDAYFFSALWLDFPRIYQVLADSRFAPAPNWAHASVPEVDKAMDEWTFAATDADMEKAARDIQLSIAEFQPVLPIYTPHVVWVHSKKLHGYQPTNPHALYPNYNDMWLEA